jgi:hemolysin activation/secretion protein
VISSHEKAAVTSRVVSVEASIATRLGVSLEDRRRGIAGDDAGCGSVAKAPAPVFVFSTHGLRLAAASLLVLAVSLSPTTAMAQASDSVVSAAAAGAGESTEPSFAIRRFEVEGATLVPAEAIALAVGAMTGPQRRFADIEAALVAVRGVYERAGITAVRLLVPEQVLDDGVVRLKVEELKVSRVEAAGNRDRSVVNARRAVPSLREGATPVDTVLSEELRLANENPARQMQVTLRSEDDGGLTGVLRVADIAPVTGLVSLDNTGTPSTGQWRLGAAVQHANLLDRDLVGTAQIQTSPGRRDDVLIASGSLRMPLYAAGVLLDASLLHSSVDSGTLKTGAGDYFLSSSGSALTLRATKLLPRLGNWEPRVFFGYDHRRVDSGVRTIVNAPSLVPSVVLRPMSAGVSAAWRREGRAFSGSLTQSLNFPGGGRSAESVFAEPGLRAGANPYYRITRLNLNASVTLGRSTLLLAYAGQWTPDALVAAEQFAIGGDGSVRGFRARLVAGDRGQRISVEVQQPIRAMAAALGAEVGWQYFVDLAQVERHEPQPGERARTMLSGAGAGVRASWPNRLSLRADTGVVVRGDGFAQPGDAFVHVALSYGF